MALDTALEQTLVMVSEAAMDAVEPWWIIGSAAVAMHGAPLAGVQDVDLLMSRGDAEQLLRAVGAEIRRSEPSARFRSAVFGIWKDPPLPVDVMGGLTLATADGWTPICPLSRERVMVSDHELFVPDKAELRGILTCFGRPKDLGRARLLLS